MVSGNIGSQRLIVAATRSFHNPGRVDLFRVDARTGKPVFYQSWTPISPERIEELYIKDGFLYAISSKGSALEISQYAAHKNDGIWLQSTSIHRYNSASIASTEASPSGASDTPVPSAEPQTDGATPAQSSTTSNVAAGAGTDPSNDEEDEHHQYAFPGRIIESNDSIVHIIRCDGYTDMQGVHVFEAVRNRSGQVIEYMPTVFVNYSDDYKQLYSDHPFTIQPGKAILITMVWPPRFVINEAYCRA